MSTTLVHSTVTSKPNNPGMDVSKTAWEDNHILSGGVTKGDQIYYNPSEITKIGIRAAPFIDVRDYGAVGNGVNDDTAAFQAAIAAAGYSSVYNQPLTGLHNISKGIIFVPPGVYNITDSLTYASGLNFVGTGVSTEILFQPTVSSKKLFSPGTNYFYDTTPYSHAYVAFKDMMIWGNSAYAQDGLYFDGVSFFVLDNVTVAGFTRYGVYVGDSHVVGAYYNQMNHCHLLNNGTDLYVGTGANALHVNGGRIRNTVVGSSYLVEVYGVSTTFDGVSFEGQASIALVYDKGVGTSITNYYEENSGSDVFIKRDASLNLISGLTLMGGASVDKLVLYENFDLAAVSDTVHSRADNLGLGSPIPIPLISNGAFRNGLYKWTHYFIGGLTTDDVESIDTTYIFNSSASLKSVHAANTNEAGVYQDIDLTAYKNKQLHITAMVKFTGTDWPTLRVQLDAFARNKFLNPIIDFGNGWQLWETSFVATSTSARVTLGFNKASATCYIGLVQLWAGGIPWIPCEIDKHEIYSDTAAPATGIWVAGNVVWNSAAVSGGTPGWVYTSTGFKAMAVLA